MKPLRVTAELPHGVCFGAPWGISLDGLLASVLWHRRKATAAARGEEPTQTNPPSAAAMATADPAELEELVKPTGFFRNKTSALIRMSRALVDDFGGEVPGTLDALVTLPGVGRKTANVVLGNAFGVPGITVDTHFARLVRRFGWTSATDPDRVEAEVGALFPRKDWTQLSHNVIWHGRRRCHARRPACGARSRASSTRTSTPSAKSSIVKPILAPRAESVP